MPKQFFVASQGWSVRSLPLHSLITAQNPRLRKAKEEKPVQFLAPLQARALPSAKRMVSLLPRGGSALVKRLGLGAIQVDWTTPLDFVVKAPALQMGRVLRGRLQNNLRLWGDTGVPRSKETAAS